MSTRVASVTVVSRTLPPLAAALAAVVTSHAVPLVGPLLIALVLGAAVANSRFADARLFEGHVQVTRFLLRLGIVLIGLRLPVADIASIGVRGIVIIGATVAITYVLTNAVGSRMELDPRFVTLLAAGFSICGAAAIAAVNDAVRAKQRDVALAVALVTLFGSAMIIILPWLARLVGLTDEQAATWAGASIHEVAQVVAAASLLGSGSIAIATTIKLGRVAMLAPTYMVAARGSSIPGNAVPLVPWFLTGFAIAVAARSTDVLPAGVLSVADTFTTVLLAAGMFGLGLGFRIRDLWPIPPQALALATISTGVAAGSSLAIITMVF